MSYITGYDERVTRERPEAVGANDALWSAFNDAQLAYEQSVEACLSACKAYGLPLTPKAITEILESLEIGFTETGAVADAILYPLREAEDDHSISLLNPAFKKRMLAGVA
jgi:hypothetical protein